ncbi:hypothetical protein [Pseudonocardia nigra]|uniref:hypothetical protein n=1 Tax=Pseudonocardia nigra TaxID=1921578 RepID=UPI001C5DB4E5|nr:hypothetical protein [Pseudonocardia nigra]
MLMLVVGTAAVLAVTLVAGLVAIVVFLTEIRTFLADTAATLEAVDEGATRLSGRLQRVQRATAAAARELPAGRG